jgi:hypothetical protein
MGKRLHDIPSYRKTTYVSKTENLHTIQLLAASRAKKKRKQASKNGTREMRIYAREYHILQKLYYTIILQHAVALCILN